MCPFCFVIKGVENKNVDTKQQDIIYRDAFITAFISSHWWPNNPGHVIVVPNKHCENIYDIEDEYLTKIHLFAKKVAIAIKKVYKPDGTSLRQHNEPAGGQDISHYHLQIFPRYLHDDLYLNHLKKKLVSPEVRSTYAEKLRKYFNKTTLTSPP